MPTVTIQNAENRHLIQFVLETRSVTHQFIFHLNISFSLSTKYKDFKKFLNIQFLFLITVRCHSTVAGYLAHPYGGL